MSDDKAPFKVKKPRKKPRKKPAAKPVVKAAPKATPNYTMERWHGKPMSQCSRCPWSTLDENEMIKHVAKHITIEKDDTARTTRLIDTGLVSPSGGTIVREEPAEDD
jgi:hypothetical protein